MEARRFRKHGRRNASRRGEIVHWGASELLIKHGAIPARGMGAMTMPFDAPNGIVRRISR